MNAFDRSMIREYRSTSALFLDMLQGNRAEGKPQPKWSRYGFIQQARHWRLEARAWGFKLP